VPVGVLLPVHLPFVPQVVDAVTAHIIDGSSRPWGTAVQVPAGSGLVGGLQVSHTPSQALSQQTLSWLQVKPATHWLVVAHVPPFAMSPHELFTHVFGAVQSAFVVHELMHMRAVASHRPGAQFTFAGVTQVPLPSHFDCGFSAGRGGPPATQLAAAHTVLAENLAHWPAAHMPVFPQVFWAAGMHLFWGSAPLCTLVQVPAVPDRLQAEHAFVQALSQHLPCAQCPEPHSLSPEQSAPRGFGPHWLMLPFWPQMFGATH